jgi:hypothetical protein
MNIDHVHVIRIMYVVVLVGPGEMWISYPVVDDSRLEFLYVLCDVLATAISSGARGLRGCSWFGDIPSTTWDRYGDKLLWLA